MAKRGVSLLDLLGPRPGLAEVLPAGPTRWLENFAVIDHATLTSPGAQIHYGTVQPVSAEIPALTLPEGWGLDVPGANTGIPFRVVRTRAAVGTGPGQNIEPAGTNGYVDLELDRVEITIPFLAPAILVEAAPAAPAHLLPDPDRTKVTVTGGAVLRVPLAGGGKVSLVERADPFDPAAPAGAVANLSFDPPSFFLGDWLAGMVVERVTYDGSATTTPAEIIARGQPPSWQGLSISEATVLLPPGTPLVGQVNIGVKDVLVGSPGGMQGELQFELGRDAIEATAVEFHQDVDGEPQLLAVTGSGHRLQVALLPADTTTSRVKAGLSDPILGMESQPQMTWRLPDGTRVATTDTGWFTTAADQTVEGTFSELVDGVRVLDTPYTFTFTAAAATPAATLGVTVAGRQVDNVVAVAGTPEELDGLQFTSSLAEPDADRIRWQYGSGADATTGSGGSFTLTPGSQVGRHDLVATEPDGRTRRVRVEVLASGGLLVGAADGVHDATGDLVEVRAVAGTYRLAGFHRDGILTAHPSPATADGTSVTVPDGALAEVTTALGDDTDPDAPADPITEEEIRRLQVRYPFNDAEPEAWGAYVPRTTEGTIESSVRYWSTFFTGARFVVIGRCCDIGDPGVNAQLATQRAAAVAGWLDGTTLLRGEQTAPTADQADAQDDITPPLTTAEKDAAWLIKLEHPDDERAAWGDSTTNPIRQGYRRADIFAVGGSYTPPPGEDPTAQQQPRHDRATSPALRRSLVPGVDATAAPQEQPESRLPFRAGLRVRWDSPTVVNAADAIPTLAELTTSWATENVNPDAMPTFPGPDGQPAPLPTRSPSSTPGVPTTEVLGVVVRWSYDSRSGQTVYSVAVSSSGDPRGLVAADSNVLAFALALAPAFLAGTEPGSPDGRGVRVAALGLATILFAPFTKDGEVVVHSVEAEVRLRSPDETVGTKVLLLADYTASIGLDLGVDGIGSLSTEDGFPLRVRYHRVGLEWDSAEQGFADELDVVFDHVSFEVADPGRWKLEGPWGELLNVVAARAGVGSSWFELDLEFALDLGVVRVTTATIRVNLDGGRFSAELRGLGVEVDIAGVLRGEGRLALGEGGAFTSSVELDIVAVGVKAIGALAFDPAHDFLSVSLGLLLPVGIPLGPSGLGIYGFLGSFVSNGRRALPPGMDDDPIGRELVWYRDTASQDKFEPFRGQWAVGLGTIIGTLPDRAFSLNATGMLVVAFPDPAVVFGIDVKLISQPQLEPTDQGEAPSGGMEILGLVAIDDTAAAVAVRGSYSIPKLLDLELPIDGWFPYSGDAFVRIGSDGVASEGRHGDPVTITLLPGVLDVQAWSYLMIEAGGLHRLGGDPEFNFDGFSVGFGAGWDIRWQAGEIKLRAGAKVLVGLGTDPFLLKGKVAVYGELDLVVLAIGANGSLVATMWEESGDVRVHLEGKFCGKVKLLWFKLEGCVGISVGDEIAIEPPPPPPPVSRVSLTDRRGFTTAVATTATPREEQTVWPDTVPVLEFRGHPVVALSGSAFEPGTPPAGCTWSGTSELKYAYRITGLDLVPDDAAPLDGPLESGWWLPTHRPGVLAEGDLPVSESEGVHLALLSWDPGAWTYPLTDGGAGTDGDPAQVPGRLCEPMPLAQRACALGRQASRTGVDSVVLRSEDQVLGPFGSRFEALGQERVLGRTLGAAAPELAGLGLAVVPGQVGQGLDERVFWLARTTRYGLTERSTEFRARLAPALLDPELVLLVCQDERDRPEVQVALRCTYVAQFYSRSTALGTTAMLGELRLVSRGELEVHVSDVAWIQFRASGVVVVLPGPAANIEVTVHQGAGSMTVEALTADGQVVDTVDTPATDGVHRVRLSGQRIRRVRLTGGQGEGGLVGLCWAPEPDLPTMPEADLPQVRGSREGGGVANWEPAVLETTELDGQPCRVVRYTPPETGRLWSTVRILEWGGTTGRDAGAVGIVQLCGTAAPAAVQQEQNTAFAGHLADTINRHDWTLQRPGRNLLEPDTEYAVEVTWQWQAWQRTDDQPAPPAVPPSGGWVEGGTQRMRFRTAAVVSSGGGEPPDPVDEQVFDPRSLTRYLIGFEPDDAAVTHLRDDPLLVHLAVDHADQLARLYGQAPRLRVRRTDLPPGSLAGGGHPLSEAITLNRVPLHDAQRPTGQQRFVEAIRQAPCLTEPTLGGTTLEVAVDGLLPGARYDLILAMVPETDPDAEGAVLARTHFQASRYRDVADLLAALGFATGEPSPILAADAIVTTGVAGSGLVVGDAELDAALAGLGLDPWPISDRARTTMLWLDAGGTWQVAGVLLEAPEPIVREGRCALDVSGCTLSGAALTQRYRNLAGTRVLLAPAAPLVPPANGVLAVEVTRTDTGRTGATTSTTTSGWRASIAVPRAVYAEAGS